MMRFTRCFSAHLFMLLLFLGPVLSFCSETQSPSLFAANTVRESLKGHGSAPKMSRIPRTAAEVRRVVSLNLNPRLLTKALCVSGADFRYQFDDPNQSAHLGVLVLQYSTAAVARQKLGLLAVRRNYFRNSKILIRFTAVPLGTLLVVIYSENSGDDRIVDALNNIPGEFEKAAGHGDWVEPKD